MTCQICSVTVNPSTEGEVIMTVPMNASVRLGPSGDWAIASRLAERVHGDPEFNATFSAFWATQPDM